METGPTGGNQAVGARVAIHHQPSPHLLLSPTGSVSMTPTIIHQIDGSKRACLTGFVSCGQQINGTQRSEVFFPMAAHKFAEMEA